MNTRRLYLTSRDSNPRVIFNDKVQIDLSKANLNVESNQKMGLSIVRATLPTTLEAVPRTTTVSNVGNNKDVQKRTNSNLPTNDKPKVYSCVYILYRKIGK